MSLFTRCPGPPQRPSPDGPPPTRTPVQKEELHRENSPGHEAGQYKDTELEQLFALLDDRQEEADWMRALSAEGQSSYEGAETEDLVSEACASLRREEGAALRTEQTRLAAYLEDLRAVLRLPGGAGLRVVHRWLNEACCFARLSLPEPHIYGAAALADYARDRMAEMALADPASHVRVQLAGARQWATDNIIHPQPVKEKS